MSPSPNYKKKIHVKEIPSYYHVAYCPLEENGNFYYAEGVKHFKETYHLLTADNKVIIDDYKTQEKLKNLVLFFNYNDQNIYSINKVTSDCLINSDNRFYYQQNIFINCIVLIMSGSNCSLGCFINGELVDQKRIHNDYLVRTDGKAQIRYNDDENEYIVKENPGMNIRKNKAKEFESTIKATLKKWNQHMAQVDVIFYQAPAINRKTVLNCFESYNRRIEKLPFEMAVKTGDLKRVYDELFIVNGHGSIHEFFNDLMSNTIFTDTEISDLSNCSFVSSLRGERRVEKQNYPSLKPDIKEKIHDSLQSDDYNRLMDIYEAQKNKDDFIQYLSSVHAKLDNQTFLHYAVRDNLPNAVQALLEMGCDPRIHDKNGKVACEIADKSMKQIFINFRLDNPLLYNWSKCHIPETNDVVPKLLVNWKENKDADRRKVKDHRKTRRESKNISNHF